MSVSCANNVTSCTIVHSRAVSAKIRKMFGISRYSGEILDGVDISDKMKMEKGSRNTSSSFTISLFYNVELNNF